MGYSPWAHKDPDTQFSSVTQLCPTLCDPSWAVVCQIPLFMGFPRQEYWNGLPFPSPEELPDPGIEPASLALAGRFFTPEPPGKSLSFSPP